MFRAFWLIVPLLCVPVTAQDKAPGAPAQPVAAELPVLREAAGKLDAFATYTLKVGYPRRAKEVYREVIDEYDRDDAVARKALGFVQIGSSWAPDPNFVFPDDERLDANVARQINKRWAALCKALGKAHRDLARDLEEAGDSGRARYHMQRVLRFLPGDRVASGARGLAEYDGFVGWPRDITILQRSRMLDHAVSTELKRKYPVKPIAEPHQKLLDRAGLPYTGVESPNFRVWGNWDAEVLSEAALHAEQSLAFCKVAFEGCKGYPRKGEMVHDLAFFKTKDDWTKVLQANSSSFSKGKLDFILKYTSATRLSGAGGTVEVAGVEDTETVYDLAVRWPAQMYSGFHSDALVEGIGHAVVGRFFGRNLVFTVGQEDERAKNTVAGRKKKKQKLILPDLSSWEDAVVESAWQRTSTPVAKLPLLKAAEFPDDGRIKSWSFCDYMLRRDPAALLALDRAAGASSEPQVAAKFHEATGGDVFELEESWRKFWVEDTPLLRAIKNKTVPLEAVSRDAPKWLEAFSKLRHYRLSGMDSKLTEDQTRVGWSSQYSADCKAHVDYLKKNRSQRDPVEVQTEETDKGGTNKGRAFARAALISVKGKDPDKVVQHWMDWPGYRDAVLNRSLDVVGLYVDGQLMAMDVTRGQIRRTSSTISFYPHQNCKPLGQNGDRSIPHEVAIAELGPDVEQLFAKHGIKPGKTIGYPLSMHFYHGGVQASSITCHLRRGGDEVEGLLDIATGGRSRRASAIGLVVFYPIKPLKRGSVYQIEWKWPAETKRFEFQTK